MFALRLASAARYRRNLTDAQKVALARAFEEHFRPAAKEAQSKAGGDKVSKKALLAERPKAVKPVHTSEEAAKVVGLSGRQLRRGKVIAEQAEPEVREAWEKGEISTNAARQENKVENMGRVGTNLKGRRGLLEPYPLALSVG